MPNKMPITGLNSANQSEKSHSGPSRTGSLASYFVQAGEQRNLVPSPALQVTRVRDGAKTRKAAASRLRRNSKAPVELMSLTEFLGRAVRGSSASSETQLLLAVMFRV